MASEYRGTEVFGRAKPVDDEPAPARSRQLGVVALFAAGITVVLLCVGLATALGGQFAAATNLGYGATGTSIIAVLLGAGAVMTRRGRGLGGVAILVGALASPLVLTRILHWASGLG